MTTRVERSGLPLVNGLGDGLVGLVKNQNYGQKESRQALSEQEPAPADAVRTTLDE